MNEAQAKDIIDTNYRILLLLGMATSMLYDCRKLGPGLEHYKYDWFMDAVSEVVYKNNPMPPFPENPL